MSGLLIKHGEWVVVCDGAKALILENSGDGKFPNLKTVQVLEQKDLATHLVGADKPGRTHSSVGPGSSSVTQPLQVCVNAPGATTAGTPITATASFQYQWFSFLGLSVTTTTVSTSATMRLEHYDGSVVGCAS